MARKRKRKLPREKIDEMFPLPLPLIGWCLVVMASDNPQLRNFLDGKLDVSICTMHES